MLKINKNNNDEYIKKIPKKSIELMKSEFREASKKWLNESNNFPEKMFIIFERYCQKKQIDDFVFFDVGAAEGCFSCTVIKNFKNPTVYAFEPDLPRFNVMVENVKEYLKLYSDKNNEKCSIQINQKLITREIGTKKLRHFLDKKTGGSAGSSSTIIFDRPNRSYVDCNYETLNLDFYVGKLEKVDAIKIDVEGGELEVLRGSKRFFDLYNPLCFIELHGSKQNGSVTIKKVKDIFSTFEHKYKFTFIEEHPAPNLSYYIIKQVDKK